MNIPIANIYYLLCYATDHVQEGQLVDVDPEEFKELPDLLAAVLSAATARLIQRGLDRTYRVHEEAVAGVRGKLDVSVTVKRQLLLRGRTFCSFDELSRDTIKNRILRGTLKQLRRASGLRSDLAADLGRHWSAMGDVADVAVTDRMFQEARVARGNLFYGFVLDLCRLVHENLLVSPETGHTEFFDFRRSEATMWALFEQFVRNFYRREQTAYRVVGRGIPWSAVSGSHSAMKHLPRMEADTVLVSAGECVVIDTKYYRQPLVARYGAKKLHSGNLYQIISYVRNRQLVDPRMFHRGVLLYAAVNQGFCFQFLMDGMPIEARTVDLSKEWRNIHEELLEIVDVASQPDCMT